jgi:anti-sigma B factor antagonist
MLSSHVWPRNEAAEHTFAPLLITSIGDGSRLDIAGELDVLTTPKMVNAALCAPADRDLTVNLSRVVFIDAAGLGGLLSIEQHLLRTYRRLSIVGASPQIARVFDLAGLNALLMPRTGSPTVLDQLTGAVLHAVRVAQPIR